MKVTKFEDLECWKEARTLANEVFALTNQTTFRRAYRLIDQMTGAAISVMNNIVEGFDSQSNAEFIKFLGYARRSASEVQTCLYVALDNGLMNRSQFEGTYQQAEKTQKFIDGFLRYLRSHRQRKQAQQAKPAQQAQQPLQESIR